MKKKNYIQRLFAFALAFFMTFQLIPVSSISVLAASENTIKLGEKSTVFEKGNSYFVPIKLKNATNPTQDSMAAACLGAYGELTIDADGTAFLTVELKSVTMGNLTDYATDIKIYDDAANGTSVKATELKTKEVDGKTVPTQIKFQIPSARLATDGVFVQMTIPVMGYSPNAMIYVDYANGKSADDAAFNYTKSGTAKVTQFGKYDVNAKVTVAKGKISQVDVSGANFNESFATTNQTFLKNAVDGMTNQWIGLYDTDTQGVSDVDTVSGATISSKAVMQAVMDALGMELPKEEASVVPNSVKPGTYSISLKNQTAIVDHSLVGGGSTQGKLVVENNGKMSLSYTMVSGSVKEPLYILGFNGYYVQNDITKSLSMDGVTYKTAKQDEHTVVTDVTIPLSKLANEYYTNATLYVPSMSNLNGTVSGVVFEKGKFKIDTTITPNWDTLKKVSDAGNSTQVTVNQPTSIHAKSAAYNKVNISWGKVNGATGYEVYQYNSGSKKYVKVATTKSTSYTRSGLTTGTKYLYKVRAYKNTQGKTYYSAYTKAVSATPKLNKVKGVKAKKASKKAVKVTWKKVNGANGYRVYRATKKNGKYKLVKTTKSRSFTDKKVKKNKKYYYKVRAYRKAGKKTVYAPDSSKVGIKVRKATLSNGTYQVSGKMYKVDKVNASMADQAINKTIKITVKNGTYYGTVSFGNVTISGLKGYLDQLHYYDAGYTKDVYGNPQGTLKDVTVDAYQVGEDGKKYPKTVTFPIIKEALEDGYVPLQVYVPIMESLTPGTGTQNMYLYLDWNSAKSVTTSKPVTVNTVKKIKAKRSGKRAAKLTWSKVSGANGYVIYRSTKAKKNFKAIKTITKGNTKSYTNKKLKKNKKYYYKMRAYRKVGNKKIYSKYSKTVSVKTKK